MSSDLNKKYKRPKKKTLATTNPETGVSIDLTILRIVTHQPLEHDKHIQFQDWPRKPTYLLITSKINIKTSRSCSENPEVICPLLAKDSEWVDILQANDVPRSTSNITDEEEVLQLVECEDGPQMKPLAIMFPGILDKDPQTLQGMLNKAMSTTEVTRHLVDLGQKANFTFMKKADRLIPPEKQWLDSVTENSNSVSSFISGQLSIRSSKFEASDELSLCDLRKPKKKKRTMHSKSDINQSRGIKIQQSSSQELPKPVKKSENIFPGKK